MGYQIQTGDVIQGKNGWEFGYRTSTGGSGMVITVSDSPSQHHRSVTKITNPDASPRQIAEGTAERWIDSMHNDAFDETRPGAKFIVFEAKAAGGGTGHGPGDVYPDGWQVKAQRLNDDGSYNPDGEIILFYQTGQLGSHCYTCQADAELVGRMVQVKTWIPIDAATAQKAQAFLRSIGG